MAGFDLIVKSELSLSEVRKALSLSFELPEENIEVVDGYPEAETSAKIKVLCMRTDAGGDYRLHLSIEYHCFEILTDPMVAASRFATVANSVCLFPSSDDNPYAMILISPGLEGKQITLRADDLDAGEYRVI
ncbi:hypothetical protein [Dyella choica]|uniref:Uncharacterized protein n=1 Tax=Dyella choica TaxID=1927959 RepID=A0A432M2P5_9GAMM|nr:hypothetical protein [Dyella choica]RUL72742.1 hypothetical protein EKH80_17050 [Dyella choica]